MPETLTLAHVVRADLIALDEHRLQAQIESERAPTSGGYPLPPKNIVGDPKLRLGCAIGVAYSDKFRARLAVDADSTCSLKKFLEYGDVIIENEDEATLLIFIQALHDSWLDGTTLTIRHINNVTEGRFLDEFSDEESAWLKATFEDNPHRPTEQDFRDFLHVIAKSRGIELPPPVIAG